MAVLCVVCSHSTGYHLCYSISGGGDDTTEALWRKISVPFSVFALCSLPQPIHQGAIL